jgi:Oxygenase domain of the 2OGFeDO superfamily
VEHAVIDLRIRTRISDAELSEKRGLIVTDDDYNVLVTRDARVHRPDGSLLCVFRRRAIPEDVAERALPALRSATRQVTNNRGLASGTERMARRTSTRTQSRAVRSNVVGAFDPQGPITHCRLTAWTAQQAVLFDELVPLLRAIAAVYRIEVPERYMVQAEYAQATDPFWVIPDTPFTTVTVNRNYSTGVHTDSGDLERGFSNLTVLRRGDWTGGHLVFPRYRLAVEVGHCDTLLMDAHEWHGNTRIDPGRPLPEDFDPSWRSGDFWPPEWPEERLSVVAYYRTRMHTCGAPVDEERRALASAERRSAAAAG